MMYKGRKIHKSTMFFLVGVLIWLLYGTHYEEVAFAQGREVEPTLAPIGQLMKIGTLPWSRR